MSKITETQIEGKQITTHLLDKEEYDEAYEQHGVTDWSWYTSFVQARGFRSGNHIFVKKNALGLKRLIAHEVGHILGYEHPAWWKPTIMNQTGLLRWADPDNLIFYAERILEDL